jgi:hypothetical protein
LDIKKTGLSGRISDRPDVLCIPTLNIAILLRWT